MRVKKRAFQVLSAAMAAVMVAGCAGQTATEATKTAAGNYDEPMTFDFYDVAANYQGTQAGWFAKVVKDKFNIELNMISPQVAGNGIYQTRCSTGNLGDIVVLERTDFTDCVKAGLIKDISADIKNYPDLMTYNDQITVLNKALPENKDGKIYGIPCQMTNTSPTSYSQDVIKSSPLLRWDLYSELGRPDIKNTDDLLDILEKMMKAHPTNSAGDPAYPLSLWKDWDGGDGMLGIANVAQLTTWYGEIIKGSNILKPDNTFIPVNSKDGAYYKMLHFLNDANRRGIVDPDSGTQDWNTACDKMKTGRVYLMWYNWQVGFWNTQDRLKDGTAFIYTPIKDQIYYADADTYYGSGRVFAVGSQVDDAKYQRIMDFLNWYASPEGLNYQHIGLKGFNYTVGGDGKYTYINDNALMDNVTVPDEFGGGGFNDGNNAINQWMVDAISTNPATGEPYNKDYWSTYKAATMTQMKKDWAAKFGAAEPVDYMKKNNILLISPNVSVSLPSDSADISIIRKQCSDVFSDYSWRMIYAKDDGEFDSLWSEMCTQMDGMGFQELSKFDKDKYQIELDAKLAVNKK
ncbi:sugar ABC transporter substrate-binding protein [Lacrimispora sp. AGF001]|jgi:multiple sugar transport system substrate-binding protein/putative aldouronate transport system substrate-binding protein|uniref:sugar ABC transporter substrate-binding protein n=1 Tax=Lacrimispora sp. AGF001 TaxID=3401631 RepID=UPI003B43314A|nr:sugar ABC transporter substrate-binding protein [Paenibacillaceae bacterium]